MDKKSTQAQKAPPDSTPLLTTPCRSGVLAFNYNFKLWSLLTLTSLYQVPNANIIHWKIGSCCSVLWTHIGNGGSVSN